MIQATSLNVKNYKISNERWIYSYSSGQVFGKVDYLNPMDTRQYLYCLSPKPELYKDTKVLKGVTNIGKLDIVWKTNLGEKGRLQTSQLQRVVGTPLYEPRHKKIFFQGFRPDTSQTGLYCYYLSNRRWLKT